jgi:branched-chain amino acid transport system substrate-binding protein
MNDMSGLYADIGGPGSVVAAKMAVEDFLKATKSSLKVEVVSADHQNKPDVGSSIARKWYDTDGVDVIVDVPTSSVALAVNQITKDKGKAFVNSGAGHLRPDRQGLLAQHRALDLRHLDAGQRHRQRHREDRRRHLVLPDRRLRLRPRAGARHLGGRHQAGGKVLGKVKVPLPGQDFSSFLLQAQSSKAKIIGLANAGGDTINSIKQAAEFGIVKGGQNLAGLLVFLTDVHAPGPEQGAGPDLHRGLLLGPERRHARLGQALRGANNGKYPSMVHAGVYAGVLHYLKAVDAPRPTTAPRWSPR